MAIAKQIKLFSNWKRYSSKNSGTKNSLIKLSNEYERNGEQKNKDINFNLSSENIIIKKFDINEYEKIIEKTDYSINSKNSKVEDIFSTTPTIQATNFINLGGINLTFLATKEEWVEYYNDLSFFIKDYMGEDYKVLCEVIQFDEFTPHLQMFGIFRNDISVEKPERDIRTDEILFEEVSRKQFTRYNNKLKDTEEYIDPKNKKEYKEAKVKWVEKNREEIINNYKPRKKKIENQYGYIAQNNPITRKKNSYMYYQQKLYEFNREHKFIKKLCDRATEIRGEQVSFVRNSTEQVYDGKSNSHYEIKETIEREQKEIEEKIANNEELTEQEQYKKIKETNRKKLIEEFLELDIEQWKKSFEKPIEADFSFEKKIHNDLIALAKKIQNKEILGQERLKEVNDGIIQKQIKEIVNIDEKIKEYTNNDKWSDIETITKLDETKEIKRKSLFDNTEQVKIDKKNYDIIFKMAKDNSSKLSYWEDRANNKDKENIELKKEIKEKNKILSEKENELSHINYENTQLKKEIKEKNNKIFEFDRFVGLVKDYMGKFLGNIITNHILEHIEKITDIDDEYGSWRKETKKREELKERISFFNKIIKIKDSVINKFIDNERPILEKDIEKTKEIEIER